MNVIFVRIREKEYRQDRTLYTVYIYIYIYIYILAIIIQYIIIIKFFFHHCFALHSLAGSNSPRHRCFSRQDVPVDRMRAAVERLADRPAPGDPGRPPREPTGTGDGIVNKTGGWNAAIGKPSKLGSF
jgi:hypothetical protein